MSERPLGVRPRVAVGCSTLCLVSFELIPSTAVQTFEAFHGKTVVRQLIEYSSACGRSRQNL